MSKKKPVQFWSLGHVMAHLQDCKEKREGSMPEDKPSKPDPSWAAFRKWAKENNVILPNDCRVDPAWKCWSASWRECGRQIVKLIQEHPYGL